VTNESQFWLTISILTREIDLQVLATLPEYRGHGVGSALIKLGLDEGMNTGLNDFWLEASNDGHALYAKYGFQDVEPVLFDLEKYGGVGMSQLMAMRRFPN
jgi:ribosomal protein S18 acetylase RimI-like enzyme